jgi:hypothetical protein
MVNEKTKIDGARKVLAAATPHGVQVIKASAAAAVHNWNDQHTADWTGSLWNRVGDASAMSGGASLYFMPRLLDPPPECSS